VVKKMQDSRKGDVRNFLSLIVAAVGGALLIVFLLVYFYGPWGHYSTRNVLIAPDILPEISYQASERGQAKKQTYLYDHLEFVYFDEEHLSWKTLYISEDDYKKFYKLVSGMQSQDEIENILDYFAQAKAMLRIYTRPASDSSGVNIFQEIQFGSHGNHFRIEIHRDNEADSWAYFKYKGILKIAIDLFAKGKPS
jgi:hypothetical protein